MKIRGKKIEMADVLAYSIVTLVVLIAAAPIYMMLSTAFKPIIEVRFYPPTFYPEGFTLDNFKVALFEFKGLKAISDSAIITIGTFVLSMSVGVPAAYSLARFKTGGDEFAFFILSWRFLPPIVPVISFFIGAVYFGVLDTYFLLIVVNSLAIVPFIIWILKGFIEEIPMEIEEAATVDGASWLQIFVRIVLPLSAPGLVAVSIFSIIFVWNELLYATILTGRNLEPFTKIIPGMLWGPREPYWGAICALGSIVTIPIIAISWYLQKYIVRGLSYGAVK